jgi:hypothetical protein
MKSFFAGEAGSEDHRDDDDGGADFYENLAAIEPVNGGAF